MAPEDKKTKAAPAPKKEAPAADKSKADAAPTKADAAPAKADTAPAKAEGGATASAPAGYSRGEGQKPVTQAYKDNWNAIFAKNSTKKKTKKKKR